MMGGIIYPIPATSLYLLIMESQLWFGPLNQQDFEEMIAVIVEANRNDNPTILHSLQTVEQFEQQTRGMVNFFFQTQEKERTLGRNSNRSYGARMEGKLVGVVMSVDVAEMFELSHQASKDHPVQDLVALFSSFNIKDLKHGVATYCTRWSVLPTFRKNGIASRLLYDISKHELSEGYEYSLQTTYLEQPSRILLKNGSIELRFQNNVAPDQIINMRVFKTDLKKMVYIYETNLPIAGK